LALGLTIAERISAEVNLAAEGGGLFTSRGG
jgi:hypothetical protein